MSETTKIHEAMVAIMRDLEAVSKDGTNKDQGWRYRSIEAVINALHPLMAKHGVYIMPEIIDCVRDLRGKATETLSTYRWHFIATDGSEVTCTTQGESLNYSDKGAQAAHSYALKYALTTAFAIQTEDMEDPDAHTIEREYPTPRETPAPKDNVATRAENFGLLTDYLAENGIEIADAERFCASVKYLKEGERLSKLTDARLSKINGNLSRFGNAIVDFLADNPQDDGGDE